ncbi:flagellar basal-body MS-ring/collar protein FliF [Trinickia terrae]|nr:flagellar basal-body MS-ring/collar protein FliF [Trinickia terrae]
MSRLNAYFTSGPRSRQFAVAAVLAALVLCAALAVWLTMRPAYQVLFRDLKRQDAAAIAAQLEKEKVPFRFDERTSAILVPEGDTRAIRLRLMSSELRLQGAVGFELFNNSDLGLTEFTQKVNYQRALQGELERTIATLDEIDMARVHLALPESSLFRRDRAKPKASVALFMRDGQTLGAETIKGIQRLVAAAVPEMSPSDVAVLDQRGAPADAAGDGDVDDPQYALKASIERRYERKILAQIGTVAGAGRVSVSVDASIDFDQVRTTRESDVTRPIANDGGSTVPSLPKLAASASAMSKFDLPAAGLPPLPGAPAAEGSRTDRTIEQIVKSPGAIRRLSVGIVLDRPLSADELAQLNAVVSASIGLDSKRGDVLSMFVRDEAGVRAASDTTATGQSAGNGEAAEALDETTVSRSAPSEKTPPRPSQEDGIGQRLASLGIDGVSASAVIATLLGALAATIAASVWLVTQRNTRRQPSRQLTDAQRAEHVTRLRALLAGQGHAEGNAHGNR